ncbi:nuclear transport factor 2 family protein [Terricaulis sp.]|uniref:YybH family protein n=1 Tax=Terricaulis sp. TaxID=2768686 RepID=UPI002AC586D1|nr:nuclear transport factor 2 family protein [Terricaulis sp.]MDZ4689957.1 nuclear transport factor 2 family protein [Terricaulis sp.]
MRHWLGAALCGAALLMSAPALAQNLALRAPQWAQALLSADVTPTTGGRSLIVAEGIPVSVRVTIAPTRGGVARVIRYDQRADSASLYVRRFTGHPSTGWWLWGGDAPRVDTVAAVQRTEIAALARSVSGVAGQVGGSTEVCPSGEQAFVEIAFEGRATSLSRACVGNTDAVGRLVLRLSELAGSRTEEELAAAAVAELLAVDRAFNAKAQADGVPAAFEHYAAEDALIVTSTEIASGRAGIAHTYTGWPQGARLTWTPETARVSARGDMGWTWGNSVMTLPDGTRQTGRYISVWTRDYEGNWKYAFDAPIR